MRYFKIKLASKYKPIVCALKNYNSNSRQKCKPGPGFEPPEVRSSNPGLGLNFSLQFKFKMRILTQVIVSWELPIREWQLGTTLGKLGKNILNDYKTNSSLWQRDLDINKKE